MNEHPHDALPALALGALDADEASQVISHVAACPACRDDVATWSEVVALLPYAAHLHEPSAHVKRRLFAMIDAGAAQIGRTPGRVLGAPRWMSAVAASALALALLLGLLLADARQDTGTLIAQLGDRDRQISQLDQERQQLIAQISQRDRMIQQIGGQFQQAQQETIFVSAAVKQQLEGDSPGAHGAMYMQPGHKHAVLYIQGLKQPEGDKVYQFWLAKGNTQVPSATFRVGQDGTVLLSLDAPAPVDEYAQVMVTVEPPGGSQKPSDQVVLRAELTT